MQLLESSPLGLRTARIVLECPNSPIQVTLFPMVHIGEAEFFDLVYADAFAHDVVLVEGVDSPIAVRITRSYRWIAGAERFELCIQPRYPRPSDVRATIIHADLAHAEFVLAWKAVPTWLRLFVYIAAPIVGLRYRWLGTRESLARGQSLEDLPRREETLAWNPETAALTTALLDARDVRLVSVLKNLLTSVDSFPSRVAILYGAQHMRAVLRELSSRGYHATDSKWLTVFSLSRD